MTDLKQLIAKFEDEIREACSHMQIVAVDFSDAALRLESLGREGLPQIVAHLESACPTNQYCQLTAWTILLHNIADVIYTENAPAENASIDELIAWAKKEMA